jgi:hypothetical protein
MPAQLLQLISEENMSAWPREKDIKYVFGSRYAKHLPEHFI